MAFKKLIVNMIRRVDKVSPYPLFYPFRMSKNEKNIFDDAIAGSKYYLEFGLGGSTLRAIRKSEANIFCVESSTEWLNYMREYSVIKLCEGERLTICMVDIGPTGLWGHPKPGNDALRFEEYSSKVFSLIDNEKVDLALVDGRFRVACVLMLIMRCGKNARLNIMIHDFWSRDHYFVVLKYLDVFRRADDIGLFTVKTDFDITALEKDYEAYKTIPE